MMANLAKLQADAEATYGKILTKPQRKRLDEIDLRRQGPLAVMRPEMMQKLNLNDDQIADMQSLQQENRDSMMQMGQQMRQQFMGPDGNFDFRAMRNFMQSDQGKAQQTKMREQGQKSQSQLIAAVGKVLTKKQKAKFNSMLGKDFDIALLNNPRGGPGGPPGGDPNSPAGAPPAATTTTTTEVSTKKTTTTTTTTNATPKPAGKRKR